MKVEKLVRMANQIAVNCDYGGDREKTVAAVTDHLSRFWSSSMKRQIIDHAADGGAGLSDLAAQAVAVLAEKHGKAA
jgi:formate dehydrogenase subunit delta